MIGKRLSVFLAIAVISFGAGSAQSCSDLETCTECLEKKTNGCSWHVGPSSAGCIDASDCGSGLYEDGECFSGRNGCKNSCSTQAGDCEDCLGYDATGRATRKGDCAWFVRDGERPQCIFHKLCKDEEFADGTCTRGKKGGNNKNKCNVRPSCDEITNCKDCLDSLNPFCAWAVHERIMDGKSTRCVDEARCDDDFKDDWSCYKGTIITNPRKVCKRIKNNPRDQLCSNLSGFRSDCLKYSCSWNRDNNKCYDTCEDAPKGANCEPPPNPDFKQDNELASAATPGSELSEKVSAATPKPTRKPRFQAGSVLGEKVNRSLLRFDSEESMLCFNWKYEDENEEVTKNSRYRTQWIINLNRIIDSMDRIFGPKLDARQVNKELIAASTPHTLAFLVLRAATLMLLHAATLLHSATLLLACTHFVSLSPLYTATFSLLGGGIDGRASPSTTPPAQTYSLPAPSP